MKKSFLTIVHVLPWGEEPRGADLYLSGNIGNDIAQAIYDATTANSLDELRKQFKGVRPDDLIPMWDGSWEDRRHNRWSLEEAVKKGRLHYIYDPGGRTHGMHGTLYVG